ncbi:MULTISPECIES: lipid IV(A) palmitoyltransferase PagP [Pectobacterium]|uniref:lipid IV(A) palmitoyltransferase PagP n=1 Tax=Pectobacterium TaxID=122277 RepID=UPI00196933CD|nr:MULTISPECIES: lipid IV(A) palmitoyltransferase PagP [Pectobacterium]GKW13858.1 lipid A palmitoyltransferase PagP [Pectobacterium carotovorum subsp. carotovorum]MBN3135151.1 lipid IV(A) palmitoyltransferase PagP [Pectobacterium punjabense]MBT9182805.1 lipid IV(A) palmitoyltransferase PagP [Pectobacterium punjabense]MCE5379369.1 lipid IV(A) palmitoyltransferase PagP [Pectobacterium punjabense]MCE9731490.1 phospholipid:lipid A palmitoyltransferase [Pectobacterium sp. IFB5596]
MHLKRTLITLSLITLPIIPFSSYAVESINNTGSMENPVSVTADSTDSASNKQDESWWQRSKNNLSTTWNAPQSHDIYIPAITWHNRWTYDKEKTDRYNERPWGAGYGVSRLDQDGDWHGLYLMAFKDSYNKWEPIGGYGYEKRWRPTRDQDFQLGLGFTAGFTMRDNWNYIPIPVLLPLASISYSKLSFQATYIPGTYNNGNVFFAWLRWQI